MGGSLVEALPSESPYRVPTYKATLPTVQSAKDFGRQLARRRILVGRDPAKPIVWSPMEEADRLARSFIFGPFGATGRFVVVPGETPVG
jgi:hypothetical protein